MVSVHGSMCEHGNLAKQQVIVGMMKLLSFSIKCMNALWTRITAKKTGVSEKYGS